MDTCDTETCEIGSASTGGPMLSGCDLRAVFNYNGSTKDVWINYTTLFLTLFALVVCTRRAGESAWRYRGAALWFWLPFTIVLFGIQILADCSTGNVGISAVWSAFVGFIFLGWWRIKHLSATASGPSDVLEKAPLSIYLTGASLLLWAVVCFYYALAEEAVTTVAHLVAFGVGAVALLLFEALHRVPKDVVDMSLNTSDEADGQRSNGVTPPPYHQLEEDN